MFRLGSTRSKLKSKQKSERNISTLNSSQLRERLQPVQVGSLTMWSAWSQWNPRSSQVMQFIHQRYDGKQWTAMESIQQLPAPLPLASWESGSRWSTSCESSDESSKPWKCDRDCSCCHLHNKHSQAKTRVGFIRFHRFDCGLPDKYL